MKTSFNIAYVYKCEYCGEAYDSESKALACEKVHQDRKPPCLKQGFMWETSSSSITQTIPAPAWCWRRTLDDTAMANVIRVKYPSKYAKQL